MPIVEIPFNGGFGVARSAQNNNQRRLNLYPEVTQNGGVSSVVMYGTPGLELLVRLQIGQNIRGMCAGSDGNLYAVCGTTAYKIVPSTGVATSLGTIPGTGSIQMATNLTQVIIVGGFTETWYIITLSTSALSTVTGAGYPTPDTVTFLDGYFILNNVGTGQFYITAINNGASINILDFATAESNPDAITAVFVDHRELWLFGPISVEIWFNSAASSDFPFERRLDAILEVGCVAKYSIAKLDNTVYWLTNQFTVVRASGYSPQIISTTDLSNEIGKYAVVDDAIAYSYYERGHAFYVITFPSEAKTWVFDASTGEWHERESSGMTRHLSNCYATVNGISYVGSINDGAIYIMSEKFGSEDGRKIKRLMRTQYIHQNHIRLIMDSLRLVMQVGIGDNSTDPESSDPKVSMRYSNDGGKNWSTPAVAPLGKIGEYGIEVEFRRLGQFRTRLFEVESNTSMPVVFMKAIAEIRPTARGT
jgi:hypothetical protein